MVPPKRARILKRKSPVWGGQIEAFGLWESAGDQSKKRNTVKTFMLANVGALKKRKGEITH